MIVLGLTGYARAGKDTVADILVRDYGFVKRSFAAPLKRMLLELNPIVGHRRISFTAKRNAIRVSDLFEMYGDEEGVKASKYAGEYRRLLQVLGTECIRKYDKDFWVRAALKEIGLLPDGARVVFTDVRFPNEAQAIHDIDGYLAQVVRPGVEAINGHPSERYVGKMEEDFTLNNDASIVHLGSAVDKMAYVIGVAI